MATKKPQFSKPASQVDLEERLANGNASSRVLSTSDDFPKPEPGEGDGRDFRVEGNDTSNYVGVSPEYATYANETERPGFSEDNPEDEVAAEFFESVQSENDPVNRGGELTNSEFGSDEDEGDTTQGQGSSSS